MLSFDDARKLAQEYVDGLSRPAVEGLNGHILPPTECIVMDEHTITKSYGWIFFYQNRRYIETEIISYALAGNAPFIVESEDGSIHVLGTALPTEDYIAQYEQRYHAEL